MPHPVVPDDEILQRFHIRFPAAVIAAEPGLIPGDFRIDQFGQPVNFASLCDETGVSAHTIKGWVSVLEASYIVFKVQPWFVNVSKRATRTPKIYFTDVGLAAYLLGIETSGQMIRDPLRGNLFENMVMIDIMKQRFNAGRDPRLYMLRTEKGFEIDALVQCAGAFRPIEIKSSMTYNKDFARSLLRLPHKEPKTEFIRPTVVYDGDTIAFSNGVEAVNFRDFKVDG